MGDTENSPPLPDTARARPAVCGHERHSWAECALARAARQAGDDRAPGGPKDDQATCCLPSGLHPTFPIALTWGSLGAAEEKAQTLGGAELPPLRPSPTAGQPRPSGPRSLSCSLRGQEETGLGCRVRPTKVKAANLGGRPLGGHSPGERAPQLQPRMRKGALCSADGRKTGGRGQRRWSACPAAPLQTRHRPVRAEQSGAAGSRQTGCAGDAEHQRPAPGVRGEDCRTVRPSRPQGRPCE